MSDDILFGAVAVNEGFISRPQLDQALREQGTAKLGEFLVARGLVTAAQIEAILDIQKINIADRVERSEEGGLFGQIAIREGYVTTSQVSACVRRQQELAAGGAPAMIGQLLLQKGALSSSQFVDVLRRQEKAGVRCAGCGTSYLVEGLGPGTKFLCRRCLRVLSVPVLQDKADISAQVERIVVDSFGPYAIEGDLGRGPWSASFRAMHRGLNCRVALRVLRRAEPWVVDHLRAVAAASAVVNQPEVVPILEVGEAEGIPFVSRPFVDGEPYGSVAAKTHELAVMVARLERVALALHRAHGRGIVHGNLRAANLFFAGDDVKIVDAGLAPLHDALGDGATLSHRAPEQFSPGPLDARTDVYSLGVLLYELLAGRPPFRRAAPDDVREAVRRQVPTRPSEIDPQAPPDLEAVCLCALAKDRDDRMATAAAFADDLARWRGGQPVKAKRLGRRRWLRKLFE